MVRCRYTEDFLREASQIEIQSIVAYVNVEKLNKFEDGAVVDIQTLVEAGAVKNRFDAVKILGNGDLTKKLTVKANAFSEGAKAKIEAAGGNVEVI